MRWSTYLDPESVFLAQDQNVMVYATPGGVAVLQFSGDDLDITTYPDAVTFSEALKVKHPGLLTRAVTMSRLIG
jgi:hypothetical protein